MNPERWQLDLQALLDRLHAVGAGASLSACYLSMALDHIEDAAREAGAPQTPMADATP